MNDNSKVIVVGLDGADYDILFPWVSKDYLPNEKEFVDRHKDEILQIYSKLDYCLTKIISRLSKDIFCLRADRVVSPYRKISFNKLELKVSGAPIREKVQLRIAPDKESGLADIRFWHNNKLLGTQTVKNQDLNLVHF